MHSLACLLLLLGIVPFEAAVVDHVDQLEINHFHDSDAKHVFTQHIFRRLNYDGQYEIVDWRLRKDLPCIAGGTLLWHDGNDLRKVRYQVLIETWTQYDPELVERAVLPKECRRELTNARTFNFQEEQ